MADRFASMLDAIGTLKGANERAAYAKWINGLFKDVLHKNERRRQRSTGLIEDLECMQTAATAACPEWARRYVAESTPYRVVLDFHGVQDVAEACSALVAMSGLEWTTLSHVPLHGDKRKLVEFATASLFARGCTRLELVHEKADYVGVVADSQRGATKGPALLALLRAAEPEARFVFVDDFPGNCIECSRVVADAGLSERLVVVLFSAVEADIAKVADVATVCVARTAERLFELLF